MVTDARDGDPSVVEQADLFVSALRRSVVVRRFAEARRRFETDPEVQDLLASFQRDADAFQRGQRDGHVGVVQVQAIRRAQARVQAHPIVREFMETQQALGAFLQETNTVISEVLGIDFGQTAGPAGRAC